jgi:hypothetical protein
MTDGDSPNLRTLSRVINKNRKNGALWTLSFLEELKALRT